VTAAETAKVTRMARQLSSKNLSRRPVTKKPAIAPTPAMAAQTLMASGRLRSGTLEVINDRVVGMMNAAAIPARARVAISSTALSANTPRSEATPKTMSPPIMTPRRPSRSPMAPAGRSRAASIKV